MTAVKVPEGRENEFLSMFYNESMFTFEGLDISNKSNRKEMEEFFLKNGYNEKEFLCYYFSGSVMNRVFGLTDDNAYSDDLTFVVIPNYYNPIVKMAVGARWFDDIVASNCIKQHAIDTGLEPDYN